MQAIRIPWPVFLAMDKTFILLLMVVCIYGSYKNTINRPDEFQGYLAKDVAELKYAKKPMIPYYNIAYGDIAAGEVLTLI